jgi:hypothetical protein
MANEDEFQIKQSYICRLWAAKVQFFERIKKHLSGIYARNYISISPSLCNNRNLKTKIYLLKQNW